MPEAAAPDPSAAMLDALAPGTRVAEFEVRKVLGSGGFGIVYLAWDHALEREVALKEYMPGTLAGRGEGLLVSLRSAATGETFALGMRSFINEARLLAQFDHPSLVKVYRFWEDNGTAYMVMPYYQGSTLRQMRRGMVVPPGEAACRHVLDPLLSALETLHREGVYHRDIAPDNILIGADGLPVLLDFGAARRVLADSTQALTSILKPHFAPLEQYADSQAMRQGPWTDLYALGGTMYFLLTGDSPVAAASRALHDDQPSLVAMRPRDCSPGFLAAIDWMLALKPPERPQSVHMLRDVIEGRITLPGRSAGDKTVPGVATRNGGAVDAAPRTDIDLSGEDLPRAASRPGTSGADAMAATELQPPRTAGLQTALPQPSPAAPTPTPAPGIGAPVPARALDRRTATWVLSALLLANVLAWWWFTQPIAASPAAAASMAAAASTPEAATPSDVAASETVLSVVPARAPRPAPTGIAVPTAAPPVTAAHTSAAPAPAAARAVEAPAAPAAARPSRSASEPAAMADNASLGPRARCGDSNFITLLFCMKRECEQPALRGHPECVKMREQEEAGRNRPGER